MDDVFILMFIIAVIDFKFSIQHNNRGGIQKKHNKIYQRLDDAGDVIMGADPQPSSSGQGGQ